MKSISGRIIKGAYYLFLFIVALMLVRAFLLRPRVALAPVAGEESFLVPTSIAAPPDDVAHLFVAEKRGVVKWFDKTSARADGLLMDIQDKVYSRGHEEGLLGLVFDPLFSQNRYVYLFYSMENPKRSRVSRFTVGDNFIADRGSEVVILEVDKFGDTHNGGQMLFGQDGYLYIAIGEAFIPKKKRAILQTRTTLYGSIIRIDVSSSSPGHPYDIPKDNPFAGKGSGIREELWAYGLRNPWRFSFDKKTGELYAADVGHFRVEEINLIRKGGDYGWAQLEGELCMPRGSSEDCDKTGYEMPIAAFGRIVSRSVIGGYVYRGKDIPWLYGKYVFANFFKGLFTIPADGRGEEIIRIPEVLFFKLPTPHSEKKGVTIFISTFYEDHDGELYIANYHGTIHKIVDIEFFDAVKGFLFTFLSFR